MTFISYAQNYEDVMLWRALRHVGQGFYIDVGAAHPDEYSVTRAFYDRRWRGVNIEPTPSYFRRLAGARPGDVNLNIALAGQSEHLPFYEVEGTGLSTLDHGIAEEHKSAGYTVREVAVQVYTLAQICRQHVTGDVHFLKIDAEGAEAAILAGADFCACRPWIILVEATRPLSTEQNYMGWEGLLTTAGYAFVYFDGLNRFYLAGEHWDDLSPAFAIPPNIFDDFIRAADTEYTNKIIGAETRAAVAETHVAEAETRAAQAETRAAQAETRAEKAAADAARATTRAAQVEAGKAAAEARADQAQNRAEKTEASIVQVKAALSDALARIAALHASTSWRITRPIRAARRLLGGHSDYALIQYRVPRERIERLRRVAGNDGSMPKQLGRLALYISFRVGARVLPTGAAAYLDKLTPRLWAWSSRHYEAYRTAAMIPERTGSGFPTCPAHKIPPIRSRMAITDLPVRRTRTVHQFHSGSSTGDAITNAMFLIQRWLRRLGYESEIFVEHRDPNLADRLFEIADLPIHDDYVLLVHHSMGYDACEQITNLAARKILMYHNITPTEFLSDFSGSIPYAELGRRQLSLLRPHMAAALADSLFNAIELRSHGYDAPVACPLLFDVDELMTGYRSRIERSSDATFTILFVGRVVASKGQADLVDAFAEFRRNWAAPCRLVLVGRMASPDATYPSEIRHRIAVHNIQDEVHITGPVSDAELNEWYRAADLYVSLSHHEGFGVPLVEAMVHDIPIIAWPTAAVPYTLGRAGVLLPDRTPQSTAAAMLRVATDPNLRTEIVARQRQELERFRLDHHLPILIQALVMAGATPPFEEEPRRRLAANMRFTVVGHLNGSYSLASSNRSLALALEDRHADTVRILPWDNGPVANLSSIPGALAVPIATLASRPPHVTGPEVVISQHYPVHIPPYRGDLTMAMFAWEESLVPNTIIGLLNSSFDGVLAPSVHVAKALIDSGLSIPVSTVSQAPDLTPFYRLGVERESCSRPIGRPFTFLHVSSCFPRKGVDLLLAAYKRAFRKDDTVRLIIKGFPNPHNHVPDHIEHLRRCDPDMAEIIMINDDLDDAAVYNLYRNADAIVLPTRAEGFNLPAAEAMAAGIPLIITGYGGHMDFCHSGEARFLDFKFALSSSHLATAGSVWVEPDQSDLADALLEAFNDFSSGNTLATRSKRARDMIQQRVSPRACADLMNAAAVGVLTAPAPPPLRLAWISTWNVRCGVAEYSRFLLEQFIASAASSMRQPTILCDDRTLPSPGDSIVVHPTWRLMDPESVERLARAISAEDPHVVVIQHHPGLLDWPHLVSLLRDNRVRNRISVVDLHTTSRLLEVDDEERATIIDGLRQVSRLMVHQVDDLNFLKELGLIANVMLFPQGAPPQSFAPTPRSLTPDDTPIIGCYGFFLPGKGIPRLIEAVARLRQNWPKARLHLLNAEYPMSASHEEIDRCRTLASSSGIGDAVVWDTAFHPHDESMRRLAKCDLLVLPYDESKESSSAAIRSAMASGVPVAVTPIGIFKEADTAVHRFEDMGVASMAAGIDLLLRDREARERYQQASSVWLKERSWGALARRLKGMLCGLRVSPNDSGEPITMPAEEL